MTTTYFEDNLLDAVTAVVMAPVTTAYALLCLVWSVLHGAMDLVRALRWAVWPAAVTAGVVLALALCVACPALPLGLAIAAVFGWTTMPRPKSTRRVSWNSFALKAVSHAKN